VECPFRRGNKRSPTGIIREKSNGAERPLRPCRVCDNGLARGRRACGAGEPPSFVVSASRNGADSRKSVHSRSRPRIAHGAGRGIRNRMALETAARATRVRLGGPPSGARRRELRPSARVATPPVSLGSSSRRRGLRDRRRMAPFRNRLTSGIAYATLRRGPDRPPSAARVPLGSRPEPVLERRRGASSPPSPRGRAPWRSSHT